MKKISLILSGVALTGIFSLGFNGSFTNQAVNIGDTGGAPQRPDLAYNIGDTWSSSYSHADLPISADGDTGGSLSYSHADFPTSQA